MSNNQLRIMVYRHSAFYSPLLGVICAGFLKEEGLEPVYFVKPASRNLYEMFARAEVDIMQAAVSTSWNPLSRGLRDIPRHFAQINRRDGFFIVSRAGGPFSWKDLTNGIVLADHAEQPLAMLKYGLHLQGVEWADVNALNAGGPDAMMLSFRSGHGEFIHLQGPAAQQLEHEGHGRVVACLGDALPPLAFSSLMALPVFLGTQKASAFMRAYRRSLGWVNEAAAREIAESEETFFEGVPIAALTAAIARYQALGTWRRDPAIPRAEYEVSMDAFLYARVFDRRFPYEDVVKNLD